MQRNLNYKKIESEQELIEIVNNVGIKKIISMYACTCKGCPIDGVGWEMLDYVYLNLSDLDKGDEWLSFNKKYLPNPTINDLIEHFRILKSKKVYDSKITVNII